jgi:hypothetical protein
MQDNQTLISAYDEILKLDKQPSDRRDDHHPLGMEGYLKIVFRKTGTDGECVGDENL